MTLTTSLRDSPAQVTSTDSLLPGDILLSCPITLPALIVLQGNLFLYHFPPQLAYVPPRPPPVLHSNPSLEIWSSQWNRAFVNCYDTLIQILVLLYSLWAFSFPLKNIILCTFLHFIEV